MPKLIILLLLSLPLIALGLSDEESERRDQLTQDTKDFSQNVNSEIKSFQKDLNKNFISKFMDAKTKNVLAQMMHKNPFEYMSSQQVEGLLIAKGGDTLKNSPRLLKGLTAWLKDKKALSGFLSILGETKKLKTYGMCLVVIFVCAFFLNLKNSKNGILKRIIYKVLLTLTTFGLNITVFFIIFKEEVSPTIRVIRESLLS